MKLLSYIFVINYSSFHRLKNYIIFEWCMIKLFTMAHTDVSGMKIETCRTDVRRYS